MEYKLTLRLVGQDGPFFGPGPARLLALVLSRRSLHRAAAEMGMAYSKAWRIVRDIEAALGEPVLLRTRGGAQGGGSELTQAGARLLAAYEAFTAEAQAHTAALYAKHFPPGGEEA